MLSAPGAPLALVTPLASLLVAKAGGPHDALLLATGSASGLGLAMTPSSNPDLSGSPPGTPLGLLGAAEGLTKDHDLEGDLQRPLLDLASAASLRIAGRASYKHAMGPDAMELAVLDLYDALGVAATAQQRARLHDDVTALDSQLQEGVAVMLFAIADAQRTTAKAMARLDPEEYQLLWECTRPTDDPMGNSCPDPFRAAKIATTKLDRDAMASAALGVLSAIEQARPLLDAFQSARLEASQMAAESSADDDADIFADPTKLIQIGGYGNDIYYGNDAAALAEGVGAQFKDASVQILTLDFSGNDLYLARAGGTSPNPLLSPGVNSSRPFDPQAVKNLSEQLVPHQTPDRTTAGYGSLVSVTVDYGGDDTYNGAIGYQGSGRLGVGILVELGGNDAYTASSASQGAGDAGIGLLYDAAGNDVYNVQYRSQGYGTVGGFGLLLDQGGDDQYSGVILVQGAGSNLGSGTLIEGAGNDRYSAVTTGTTASQGASHLIGVGVLVDGGGYDAYTSSLGARGHVFFAPAPYGVGTALFADRGHVDTYSGGPGANGGTWQQGTIGYGVDRA